MTGDARVGRVVVIDVAGRPWECAGQRGARSPPAAAPRPERPPSTTPRAATWSSSAPRPAPHRQPARPGCVTESAGNIGPRHAARRSSGPLLTATLRPRCDAVAHVTSSTFEYNGDDVSHLVFGCVGLTAGVAFGTLLASNEIPAPDVLLAQTSCYQDWRFHSPSDLGAVLPVPRHHPVSNSPGFRCLVQLPVGTSGSAASGGLPVGD